MCRDLPWGNLAWGRMTIVNVAGMKLRSQGVQVFLMSFCLCLLSVRLAAGSAPSASVPSTSVSPVQPSSASGGSDLSSYTQPTEKTSKKRLFSKRSSSSDSDLEDEPGIDPALFPRIIDFGKVNSSSIESDPSSRWGFDEALHSSEANEVVDGGSDFAEFVFPTPSVSPSLVPDSVIIFEVEKKVPSPRPMGSVPLQKSKRK